MWVCRHCEAPFVRVKSQVYCSLLCAVMSRVQVGGPDACWPWSGAVTAQGYGVLTFQGKLHRAHRAALILSGAPGDQSLGALHECDNPPCCNDGHLYWGDQARNNADRFERMGQHMAHGEGHWRSLLSNLQVQEVRKKLAGGSTQVAVAAQFGVKRHVIADIATARAYRHIAT